MALPRHIAPGKTYLVVRRIRENCPLFRPDSGDVSQIVSFCLAESAIHHPVEVHAAGVLLDHLALVITDTAGLMPKFFERSISHIACCTMELRGRDESIFAPGSYQAEELNCPEDILDAIASVIASPVTLGLVKRPQRWPGLLTLPEELVEGRLEAARPAQYFGPRTGVAHKASLALSKPALCAHMSDAQYVAAVQQQVDAKVREAQEAMREERKQFVGEKAVAKVALHEPWRCEKTRAMLREARQIQRRFVRQGRGVWARYYWEQRQRWIEDKDERLPSGSYALPGHFNVEVAPLEHFALPCEIEDEARVRASLGRVARQTARLAAGGD